LCREVIRVLSEQQPLGEAVNFVLKAIQSSSTTMQTEVFASLLWEEGHEDNTLIALYEHASLLAALSSSTSMRTNSKQLLSDFLSSALTSGQGKPHGKLVVKKFTQYLSKKDDPQQELGSNFLRRVARMLYLQQMPGVPTYLLTLSPSEMTTSMRPSKALSNFV